MQLLCFAHRGECISFLDRLALRPLALSFAEAWQGDGVFILLTGEGIEQASRRVASFSARYEDELTEVINLGIAGGLSSDVQIDTIYPVRTVYGQKTTDRIEYQSYSTPKWSEIAGKHSLHGYERNIGKETAVDCVSARERVLSAEGGKFLAHFADLVDRELWGIAAAVSLFRGITLHAYKLVSETEFEQEICQRARADRERYSSELYRFWEKHLAPYSRSSFCRFLAPSALNAAHETANWQMDFIKRREGEGFYFTRSMQNRTVALLSALARRHGWQPQEVETELARYVDITAKDSAKTRARVLMKKLQELVDPFRVVFEQKLADTVRPLQAVARVSSLQDTGELTVSSVIKNADDLQNLRRALADFDYSRYRDLLAGRVDAIR